jgi:iron(III) transport system ATP-binding protein
MAELTIQNLSHRIGIRPILQDLSFRAAPGKLTCLVGPSGSGKSTLLRLIAGLENLQQGKISLGETSLCSLPAQARQVGLVFQHPSLFPHLTIARNITFGLQQLSREAQQESCAYLLKMIGLQDRADAFPHQLSGGQQQRVALARALAPKPRIMLLDEPFANLDYRLRREMGEDVLTLLKEAAVPMIMVTHDPEEALMMADHMVLLSADGKLHQQGEPDSLHNAPIDAEAAAFFGPINRIPGHIRQGVIHSALGELPQASYAPGLADGTKVEILTRPEGLRIARKGEPCTHVTIERIRHTGAGWLIRARLESGASLRFHHIYGPCPQAGERACIAFEPPHLFVFAMRKN